MVLTRSAAIEQLPATYQRIIVWLDSHVSVDEMADQLQLEPDAVRNLVVLAEAKLASLLQQR